MKQKSLIEAHNNTINRLVDISQRRQAKDLDFVTRSSINFRDAQFSPCLLYTSPSPRDS